MDTVKLGHAHYECDGALREMTAQEIQTLLKGEWDDDLILDSSQAETDEDDYTDDAYRQDAILICTTSKIARLLLARRNRST